MECESELYVGQTELRKFCEASHNHSDPVIILFFFDDPPDETKYEQAVQAGEIEICIRQNILSLFFPHGYRDDRWNRVLVSVDESFTGSLSKFKTSVFLAWMYGIDTDMHSIINDKFFIRTSQK